MPDDLDFGNTVRGLSAGETVFERYTLKRILGRGGMGVVWLANDNELERDVALKFLPEVVASDPQSIKDLKRETRRSLDLTHPHIVRIYDFVQNRDKSSAGISMEFVTGSTLAQLKVDRPGGHFEAADIEAWVEQLVEALRHAHERVEVVHRDLKPANLMIDGRDDLKITDFGIAASVSDSVSRVSAQMGSSGTPVYMSPQQMMGELPAVTDDVYAIGATIYELLTGRPPFYSGNVMMQVMNKAPPRMAERRQELEVSGDPIPETWESTVAACLAKEATDRPTSVTALWAGLQGQSLPPPPLRQDTATSSAAKKTTSAPPPLDEAAEPPALPTAAPVRPLRPAFTLGVNIISWLVAASAFGVFFLALTTLNYSPAYTWSLMLENTGFWGDNHWNQITEYLTPVCFALLVFRRWWAYIPSLIVSLIFMATLVTEDVPMQLLLRQSAFLIPPILGLVLWWRNSRRTKGVVEVRTLRWWVWLLVLLAGTGWTGIAALQQDIGNAYRAWAWPILWQAGYTPLLIASTLLHAFRMREGWIASFGGAAFVFFFFFYRQHAAGWTYTPTWWLPFVSMAVCIWGYVTWTRAMNRETYATKTETRENAA